MHGPTGLSWRTLRRQPLRTALTICGIAIGVALVGGALSVERAAADGAAGYAAQIAGRADLVVRAFGEGTLSAASLAVVADTPGVLAVSPQLRRPTFASDRRGSLGAVTLVGVDPPADRALHDETLAAGAPLSASDPAGALVPAAWAAAHGVVVGSRVTLVGGGGEQTFVVRGLLAAAGPALANGGRLVFTTIGAARALFGVVAGSADLVEVRVDPAVGVAAVETRLEGRLTAEPYLLSTTTDEAAALRGATRDVSSGLLFVAAAVLFVGALLVSDALAMSVAERTREVGLLRSAGATRGQVHRMVLTEGLWLGASGSLLGIVLGAGVALVLTPLVASLSGAPISAVALDPAAFAVAVLLGLCITLLAALEPAWRAGRVSPVEALRRGPGLVAPAPRLRGLAVVAASGGLVGLVVLVGGGWNSVPGPTVAGASGATAFPVGWLVALVGALAIVLLVFVTGLLAPLVLRLGGAVVGLMTLPFRRALRAELLLARGALAHDPGRIAVTFAALVVGLALLVGLAGVAEGTRRAGEAWLDQVAPADLAVTAIAPVPADFGGDLAAVAGVASVTPVRLFDVGIAGRRASAMAVDPTAYEALGALVVDGGSRRAAFAALRAGGAALVPRSLADRFGLRPGDLLELRTAQGETQVRIAAIVAHTLPGAAGESVVVSAADAQRALGIAGATLFLVRAAPGAAQGLAGRLAAVADRYALSVVERSAIGGAVTGAIDRTFGLLDLLALAAVLVAAAALLDLLAMDVRQRVGELGLLRAAGLTRRQAWRSVAAEAGILGLAGALLGSLVGVAGAATVLVFDGTAGMRSALDVPWGAVLLAFVLGVGGSLLAAAYPARLAARVEIARALRFE